MNYTKPISISNPFYNIDFTNGKIKGKKVVNTIRYLKDLSGFYENEKAFSKMESNTIAYQVQAIFPVEQSIEGGLFFGRTIIEPGKVGDEYFMTKGHIHKIKNRAEYYWCIQGKGMLILMDEKRQTRAEKMSPGSLHYIPGHTAHRTANIGNTTLIVGACWASDAGHDYQEILTNGFSARLKEINGKAVLISKNK